MPRPFAYNSGAQIPGTLKFGNLSVGASTQKWNSRYGGVRWFNGPAESTGWVLGFAREDNQQPGFIRTDSKGGYDFISMVNNLSGRRGMTRFLNGETTAAKSWLNSNGFWTNWASTDCYVAKALGADASNGAVFDRSISVNGMLLVVAGAVGGQLAVPDEWAKKVARSYQLITDPNGAGINLAYQNNLIETLLGYPNTVHAGLPTSQRIGYGSGDDYTPNWLTEAGAAQYAGYVQFLDSHVQNDMVWYSGGTTTGDQDIESVFEHIFHTIHLFGIYGAVPGSEVEMNWQATLNPNWQTTELHLAMAQAINNNMYNPSDYAPNWATDPEQAELAYKEYTYLLNWGMWEMSTFWDGGSLAPEWNDIMRTPSGIQANNLLGYTLFNDYFAPVLSKPSFTTLRTIFQDNDGGVSGYVPKSCS
jgi:hypothetical protein